MHRSQKLAWFISLFLSVSSSLALDVAKDTRIKQTVTAQINADNALKGSVIEVKTSKGIVTLSGKVDSERQALRAVEIAQSAPQVNDVDIHDLNINNKKPPTFDALITAKIIGLFIQQKIFGESEAAARLIRVETKNGIVSLSGKTETQEQIDFAIEAAKSIHGVKEVKSTIEATDES